MRAAGSPVIAAASRSLKLPPGAILRGATAIGLGFPNTRHASVGPGIHYLAEDTGPAITAAILARRPGIQPSR